MEKFQKSTSESLVEALDQEIRSRGYGSISKLERALGEQTGWWHYRRQQGDLHLQDLLAILDHLGLHPIAFLRRHLSTGEGLDLDRPQGEPPPIVEKAWDRVIQEQEAPGVGESFLEALDDQRYHQPAEVVQMAESALPLVETSQVPRLLGILGSAYRVRLRLQEAAHIFSGAIGIAQLQNNQREVGNLLRRFSYVEQDHGHYAQALAMTERATLILFRENDQLGLAKAAVEQGLCHYYLGGHEDAAKCFDAALERLPTTASRYRCAALQTLGLIQEGLGDFKAALSSLERAERSSGKLGRRHQAKLRWLNARIQAQIGETGLAIEILWQVIETFHSEHFGEAALATCDLVQVQLRRGDLASAYLTASSMRALLEPLRHNKIISAAIAQLLRADKDGLSMALVARIRDEIEAQRKDLAAWSSLAASAQHPTRR